MATRSTDRPAGNAGPPRGRRVLVLANAAVGGEHLVAEILKRVTDDAEVRIVSPALVDSPLALAAGNVDDEIAEAGRRLETSVDALRQKGVRVSGEVGEAQPELAMRDGLFKFPADEVIIVAHPEESANWMEKDLLERSRRELAVPIAYVEVASEGTPPAAGQMRDVSPKGPEVAAARAQEEFETSYLPPMPRRDLFALALGILGTVALWLLASACHGQLAHDFAGDDPACIAIMVLAIFGTITAAIHIPALLLLRSGRYTSRGLTDFMSKFIIMYFVPALIASAIIVLVT